MARKPSLRRRIVRRLLRPLVAPLVARRTADLQAETDALREQVAGLEDKIGRLVGQMERLVEHIGEVDG